MRFQIFKTFGFILFIFAIFHQCKVAKKTMDNTTNVNALLKPWEGQYGGVPPFDKVQLKDFKPALLAAMAEDSLEIQKIVEQKDPPSFENTIAALEKTGSSLNRVINVYSVWSGNMNSEEFQTIETEMQPKLAAFVDNIMQNEGLFKRIEAVYKSPKSSSIVKEQRRLLDKYYDDFVLNGAKLNSADKAKVAAINQKLASLFTKFSQNLLADENDKFLAISDSELAKMPEDLKESLLSAAKDKKLKGGILANTRSAIEPFLTFCPERGLREKAWRMFVNRGDNGDQNDNNAIIPQILALRAERAKLFGYPTHAHWKLSNKMAKTPDKAMDLLLAVWQPAVARVKEEVADMQAIANSEKLGIKIEPWDYRYYAEKVRKAKYDLDESQIKPYLDLEKMREGMFWMAGQLFDLKFDQINDVPKSHPDVRVWKVIKGSTGALVGLWYFDPYAREGKRSGAWMTAYREQSRINGDVKTLVSNNSNFLKGKPNEPVLISLDDANTLFHEFGHALHGLCSDVTYPKLSGTNVATDYVEFPSQILERWLLTPEILNKFAVHYQTKQPIPKELVQKIENASKFNQGFATVEYLASALIDMKLHLAGDKPINADQFEKVELTKLGMPDEIVMRHRTPQFAHIFADDGYSAGYYSYLWSDVHSADAFEAFTEAGGPYDKAVAKRLLDHVFSVGGTVEESEGYKAFRGKNPSIAALMKNRGFPYNGK